MICIIQALYSYLTHLKRNTFYALVNNPSRYVKHQIDLVHVMHKYLIKVYFNRIAFVFIFSLRQNVLIPAC